MSTLVEQARRRYERRKASAKRLWAEFKRDYTRTPQVGLHRTGPNGWRQRHQWLAYQRALELEEDALMLLNRLSRTSS